MVVPIESMFRVRVSVSDEWIPEMNVMCFVYAPFEPVSVCMSRKEKNVGPSENNCQTILK